MINIGNRRELFVDNFLIDEEKTTAPAVVHKPVKRDVAFTHDAQWETLGAAYHNIVITPEGKRYMYYKSMHQDIKPDGADATMRRICVIQSDDGLNWTRPELVITPIFGKRIDAASNNVISGLYDYYDNMFVFYDTNPNCPENERFKAVYGEWGTGMFGYVSADGINFRFHPGENIHEMMHNSLMISGKDSGCYFDSLNTVYYNHELGKYVAFVRGFHVGDDYYPPDPDVDDAVRDIRYTVSDDFWHWSYPEVFKYNDEYDYQLYANAIAPYYRAPHIYCATPTRYVAWPEWNDSFEKLPNAEERRHRHRGKSMNDAIFMSSRDGQNWFRYGEAFMTAGPEHHSNWKYGDCYPCVGFTETPGEIPGTDPYLSMFCKEDHENEPTKLYRYSLRLDGFVSRTSTLKPQMLVTKPFVYEGKELEINFETSALGYMKFKLRANDGTELWSKEVMGNKVDRIVGFENGTPADLSGKEVVMEIEMSDASIYSFKFN